MIAGAEATRSGTWLLTQLVAHRNCRHWQLWILQQWIYEFCYQLGMHLKFRNQRRILIGPEVFAYLSDRHLTLKRVLCRSIIHFCGLTAQLRLIVCLTIKWGHSRRFQDPHKNRLRTLVRLNSYQYEY